MTFWAPSSQAYCYRLSALNTNSSQHLAHTGHKSDRSALSSLSSITITHKPSRYQIAQLTCSEYVFDKWSS